MQHLRYITIIFLFFGLWEPIHAAEKPDVRDVRWGMNQKEVIQREQDEPNQQAVRFYTKHLSYNVSLEYFFFDNKLFEALFTPIDKHSLAQFYKQYLQIALGLTDKYGKPHTLKTEKYEIMQWETPRTQIVLTFQIKWFLSYRQQRKKNTKE